MTKHFYGWKPELGDIRDLLFEGHLYQSGLTLPSTFQLDKTLLPPVYDQGELGSCTANSVAANLSFMLKSASNIFFDPSRLFIYYNERKDQNTIKQDSGATIRGSLKAVANYGACPEKEWPYDIKKFTTKPTKQMYADGLKDIVHAYQSVPQDIFALKTALFQGHPVCIGISVYSSFESDVVAKNGIVPMPAKKDQLLGGHAVLIIGYNDITSTFICRNSWGVNWGKQGYFELPYSYVLNNKLASDFWIIQTV